VDEDRHVVSWSGRRPTHSTTAITNSMIMRPVFWRYYGVGESVRRAIWVQDAGKRLGLQPYSEQSANVLEDAYQFLKWQMGQGGVTRWGERGDKPEEEEEEEAGNKPVSEVIPAPPSLPRLTPHLCPRRCS
jgi:hypothetical protein